MRRGSALGAGRVNNRLNVRNCCSHLVNSASRYATSAVVDVNVRRENNYFATTNSKRKWVDLSDQRKLLDAIGQQLGVTQLSDWYKITSKEVLRCGGRGLFRYYATLEEALRVVYPEYNWLSTKFARLAKGFWSRPNNQRQFLEDISKELNIKQLSDWYSVSQKDLIDRGGQRLFEHYDTLERVLRVLYPDYPWDSSRFLKDRNPRVHWGSIHNQRQFLERVGQELGVKQLEDWYRIPRVEVERKGGSRLFFEHPSLEAALRACYPSFSWQSEKFVNNRMPLGHWKNQENLIKALEQAELQMGITHPEDWYSVTLSELREVGFPARVSKTRLAELLAEKYPQFEWDRVYLLRGKLAQQKRLERAVRSIFPDTVEMLTNVRKEGGLIDPDTGEYLELDLFLPSLNLAFEYQERHHFVSSESVYKPLEETQARDALKKRLAIEKGISLIPIPFWWDGTKESLLATIRSVRKDLVSVDSDVDMESRVIPSHPPEWAIAQAASKDIEGIGQPITACFLTSSNVDPTTWWLFEKYDGVRAFWNPETKTFYSRTGKSFLMPEQIVNTMPTDIFLDGELWFGRETFQEAMKIAYRVDPSAIDWKNFKYIVFDTPNRNETYAQRYAYLEEYFRRRGEGGSVVEVARREVCRDSSHMDTFLQDVLDKGGEGIILRDPSALYTSGRSPGFLKHKKFRDAEARIVAPAGMHQWECEMPNGVRFVAAGGSVEFVRRWEGKINVGDVVSFRHHGFLMNSKKPKLPTLHRIRYDITWNDVISQWKDQQPKKTDAPSVMRKKSDRKPRGYWSKVDNRQTLFTELAKSLGINHLSIEDWKSVDNTAILNHKGAQSVLSRYGSLEKALAHTFPQLAPEIAARARLLGSRKRKKRVLQQQ